MKYKIVIPARFSSTRLPGKSLIDILGHPMIWHTYQRALETGINANDIVIATDHQETMDIAKAFGAQVVMTRTDHESGTSRIAEVAEILNWSGDTIIVNLQGDEPLLDSKYIELAAQTLADNPHAGIATLGSKIMVSEDLNNPNCVKVVCDYSGKAIYFSRSAIPFARDGFELASFECPSNPWLRHIGMYAYRVETLFAYQQWPCSVLESLEKLEQLRAIYNNAHIQVACVDKAPSHGVDNLDDLIRVRNIMAQKQVRNEKFAMVS
ncbi:3-deoxy-manno-octulosonate cytidylyltransferase [Shewanella sp. VB17]|uniref:3-deoxy-manno-octulosonate cytidylyltransferase n=1 Tax=Shewanella sp. VB17 TaxID=2739432 RepID=UPI00156454D9|nr:3-deoxy-manno-octulosonate cytidylyltransferase [Shewanella sp. VB17]NRD72380.1 3-deoxy-manno-octulosonate cytidylyltransferase [Shewanella sp. VB17]